LSDSVDSDTTNGFLLHIEVASSRDSNYNMFVKHVRVSEVRLETNMGLFSFDELCQIRGDHMSKDEALFRYTIVEGGVRVISRRNFQEKSKCWTSLRMLSSG